MDSLAGRSASLADELKSILRRLSEDVCADVVTLFAYDPATSEFYLPTSIGLRDEETFATMLPRPDGIASRIVADHKSLISDHVQGDVNIDGPFARRERIVSAAGFPLLWNGQFNGVLFVSYRSAHLFQLSEIHLVEEMACRAAGVIATGDTSDFLKDLSKRSESEEDRKLRALVKLASNVLNLPTALWLPNDRSNGLRIHATTGVPSSYVRNAEARRNDGSVVAQVLEEGEPRITRSLADEPRFRYQREAAEAGWISSIAYPIHFHNQTVGVVESFSFEAVNVKSARIHTLLQRIAELASAIYQDIRQTQESRKLAEVARVLSATADNSYALQVIAESARELSGADSCRIFLKQKRSGSFVLGGQAPARGKVTAGPPRTVGGLTSSIMKSRQAVHVPDTTKDGRIRRGVIKDGVLSLIGVCLQMEEEPIGVLYVNGSRREQFTQHDERLMQTLADHAALALGWARLLLKPSGEIERVVSNLFDLRPLLEELCSNVQTSLGYDFAAVQMINPEEGTIETVHDSGQNKKLSSLSKHFLEPEQRLRDIQADIALEGRTEIIAGEDPRFDSWIFDEFQHAGVSRVFTPIWVVKDREGELVRDWFKRCRWVPSEKSKPDGYHIEIQMATPENAGWVKETIGTFEAGYLDPARRIEAEEGLKLVEAVGLAAPAISERLLPHVLEVIAQHTVQVVHADSASLHFLYDEDRPGYVYEVAYRELGRRILKECKPRKGGLGTRAIEKNEPQFVPSQGPADSDLDLSREVFAMGVRAMVALPLIVSPTAKGVMYIHFVKSHRFTENELDFMQLFANRAVDAIRHATTYTAISGRARQLAALHSVSHSLVAAEQIPNLFRLIAWNTLNLFGADVVSIYEYNATHDRFETPPEIAGRLRSESFMSTELGPNDAPRLLAETGKNIFVVRSSQSSILNCPDREAQSGKASFVIRERISSSAGIVLRAGNQIVGVMFVNYRRRHIFSNEEQELIQTLASVAAIAIKNQRILDSYRDVEREIITTLDVAAVLKVIVDQAQKITGSNKAAIYRLDTIKQDLVLAAEVPEPVGEICEKIINDEIINQVAREGKTVLARDGSALCVPLLDGPRSLGVLSVKSFRNSFTRAEQGLLEGLAKTAVIAILNAQKQRRLTASETVNALGDLAFQVVHIASRDVGMIGLLASEIEKRSATSQNAVGTLAEIQALAKTILSKVEEFTAGVQLFGRLTADQQAPGPVDPRGAVQKALARVSIPKNIERSEDLPAGLPAVEAEEHRLTGVFVNLVQNAVEAMPDGGCLWIDGSVVRDANTEWVVINVNDNGKGIDKQTAPRVFDPHFSTKETDHNLGFGLWWARSVLEALGGSISFTSEPHLGALRETPSVEPAPNKPEGWTQFTVKLPVWKERIE